jgi:hypothetical protein
MTKMYAGSAITRWEDLSMEKEETFFTDFWSESGEITLQPRGGCCETLAIRESQTISWRTKSASTHLDSVHLMAS